MAKMERKKKQGQSLDHKIMSTKVKHLRLELKQKTYFNREHLAKLMHKAYGLSLSNHITLHVRRKTLMTIIKTVHKIQHQFPH